MKQNVIVLDFDGLFSYPDFKTRVLEPLVEQEREFAIWTFNYEENVRLKLERMGLPDLTRHARIIDAYRYEWLRTSLGEVLDGFRPMNDGRFIQNLLLDSEILPTEETVVRALEHYQAILAFEAGERFYKYPPFLGDNNYLLVESDRASGLSGSLSRINPNTEFDIAEHGGHSLIMVPEHPECWHGFVYPSVDVTPEQVMDTLAPAIVNWNGEPIRRDLGIELGIFQESEAHFQESFGRAKERY